MNREIEQLGPPACSAPGKIVPTAGRRAVRLVTLVSMAAIAALAAHWWTSGNDAAGIIQERDSIVSPDDLREINELPQIAIKLSERLAKSPDDPDRWALLARTYAKLGQHAKAKSAFQMALKLRDTDAGVIADYADMIAYLNNQDFTGEPQQLIKRALQIDPANNAALMLAGLAAFDQKQFSTAISYWEKVVKAAGIKSQIGGQAQSGIDEARKRMVHSR